VRLREGQSKETNPEEGKGVGSAALLVDVAEVVIEEDEDADVVAEAAAADILELFKSVSAFVRLRPRTAILT